MKRAQPIEVYEISPGVYNVEVPEKLYLKLKEAAGLAGFDSVDSYVSESLLPTRLNDMLHIR